MGLLKPLTGGQGWLKAGFLGFTASGKTHTAVLLAIGTRDLMKEDGPIAFFDTESGSDYWKARIKEATGKDLLGLKSRSFADLMAVAQEAEASGCSVFIVDSITHVWRELCDATLAQINEKRMKRGLPRQFKIEFQDWNVIKAEWSKWTDWFLNSKMHVIICGRAGWDYEDEVQENGKRQLVKTGVKMKVETEFGFEPSLLIEMERDMIDKRGKHVQVNRATVIKDRWDVINGKTFNDPDFSCFKPHVDLLVAGVHSPVDTRVKTEVDVDEQGQDQWTRERRKRKILSEEIKGELISRWPTEQKDDKLAKSDKINELFGTRSWTLVEEGTDSSILQAGLARLRSEIRREDPREAAEAEKALAEFGKESIK